MVFKGTAVTKGVGRAVVTATAMATQTGQIAGLVRTVDHEPTPLQREVARASRLLGIAVLAIAVVVIATIFLVFGIHSAHDVVTAVLLGVSLAVAAVPEGLPAIMSVVLALGMRRMAAKTQSSRSSLPRRPWGRPRWSARARPAPSRPAR